jgi:ubiquinone/menaquinone biosynthesis C-methylase UbiE
VALIRRRPVAAIQPLDYAAGLAEARSCVRQGAFPEAFDRYELLTQWHPGQCVETLAELYDAYQQLPDNESRYFLYQSRHFDFVIDPADKVLDVGSGNNPFPFATHLADIALTDDRYGRAGAPFKTVDGRKVYECNIESMPFEDGEFDFVFCSHVLEHVADPSRACEEIMRVGKRGYIETPTRAKDLWLNCGAASNHRWYVELDGKTLLFTEYSPRELAGLSCDILMNMHCAPQTTREKAFSALVILKSDLINTMLVWEGRFTYAVRRAGQEAPVTPSDPGRSLEELRAPAFPLSINTDDTGAAWWLQSLVRHPFFKGNGRFLFAGSDFDGLLGLLPESMVDKSQFFRPSANLPAASRPLPQANLIFGRLEKLPYEDDSFDRGVLMDPLQAADLDRAASELWRVTKSGGQALAIVPSTLAPAFSKEIANMGAINIDEFPLDAHIALVFEKPGPKPASAAPEAEAKPLQSRENPQPAAASIDFGGIGPINPDAWCTSIFYCPNNCLGI